jgi:hypothetical protein
MTPAGSLLEGTPILCRRCGSGMTLLANMSAQCRHCGAIDALPADELGRMLDIKNRLALAEQRTLQVRGVDATLAAIFEDRAAFWRVSGLYLAVALLVTGLGSVQLVSLPNLDSIPPEILLELLLNQAIGPLILVGVGFSFAVALGYGRRHYRKAMRPLLVAKPPSQPGARARCRVCGGDLPEARSVDVRCGYCHSVNLIPKALHQGQAEALAREAEALKARITSASVQTISLAKRMRRVLIACVALSIATGLLLPAIVRVVLPLIVF